MYRFHVILHLVRPRKLLLAHRTGKNLPLVSLVVQERVPLETVLILESLLDVHLGALRTLVHPLVDGGVPEQVQPPDGHFGELFGGVLALRRGPTSHPPFRGLSAAGRRHGARAGVVGRGRRGHVVVVVQVVGGAYSTGFGRVRGLIRLV